MPAHLVFGVSVTCSLSYGNVCVHYGIIVTINNNSCGISFCICFVSEVKNQKLLYLQLIFLYNIQQNQLVRKKMPDPSHNILLICIVLLPQIEFYYTEHITLCSRKI